VLHRLLKEDVLRPASARGAQLRHQLGLDRNPLRRRSDRIEATFLLVAIVAFVPLATVAAILLASWTHSAGAAEQRAGSALTPVTAVLVQRVPMERRPAASWLWVKGRWVADGRSHLGLVSAPPGSQPGKRLQIWVDRAGKAQPEPLTTGDVTARVVLVSAISPLAVALGLWLCWRALKRTLDRRRMAAWGRAWSVVGPLWTWHR